MDERARWGKRVAGLLRAGTPLLAALETAKDETDSFELAGPLGFVVERVRAGVSLASALGEVPEVFDAGALEPFSAALTMSDIAQALDALGPWEPPHEI